MEENDIVRNMNLEKVAAILHEYPILFAYLFGSRARGMEGPLSDLDIALFVESKMSPSDRFDLKLRLSSRISSFSGTPVDLVLLNDAPVPLAYEVIKYGKLILCMDPEKRVDYETFVLRKYLDRRFYDKRYSEQNLARIARGQ